MLILIAAVAAAAAVLLPPEITGDLRCVAVLGVAAKPAQAKDGALYAAIAGADAMDAGSMSREAVRDIIIGQVTAIRAKPASATEFADCTKRMYSRIAIEKVSP